MAEPNENLLRKLEEIDEQYRDVQKELLDPDIMSDHRKVRALSVRRAAMAPIAEGFRAWRDTVKEIEDLQSILDSEEDQDLLSMAREEMPSLQTRTEELLEKLQQKLVMADDETIGSVILEIRSGVGGDEAALFAGDLLEMYRRFASEERTIEVEFHGGEQGGYRSTISGWARVPDKSRLRGWNPSGQASTGHRNIRTGPHLHRNGRGSC